MAVEVPLAGRTAFLEELVVDESVVQLEPETAHVPDELLHAIEAFIQEIESEIENPDDPWDYYGEQEYDDEDDLGSYQAFVNEMEDLLDRTHAAFDSGDFELARKAYQQLFYVFDLEDDYGRGLRSYHLGNVDFTRVNTRHLRSICETTPRKDLPAILFEELKGTLPRFHSPDPVLGLEAILEAAPHPLSDQDAFIADWVAFLRQQPGLEADHWLREAVRLSEGIDGLRQLALDSGNQRPHAYLDWIAALLEAERTQAALEAVQQAEQTFSLEQPIRASIADHKRELARRMDDATLLLSATWEALYSRPSLVRLVDLHEQAVGQPDYVEWLQRAAVRLEGYGVASPESTELDFIGSRSGWLDTGLRPTRVDSNLLTHALLLAGRWDSAYELARQQNVLGWSNSANVQGLVVLSFLGILCGKCSAELPPNLALLWEARLGVGSSIPGDPEIRDRLRRAYDQVFGQVSLGERASEWLPWCLKVSEERVNQIVQNQHRGAYPRAASLTVSCAEVLRLRGDGTAADVLVTRIRMRFPRHRSFQSALKTALSGNVQ